MAVSPIWQTVLKGLKQDANDANEWNDANYVKENYLWWQWGHHERGPELLNIFKRIIFCNSFMEIVLFMIEENILVSGQSHRNHVNKDQRNYWKIQHDNACYPSRFVKKKSLMYSRLPIKWKYLISKIQKSC